MCMESENVDQNGVWMHISSVHTKCPPTGSQLEASSGFQRRDRPSTERVCRCFSILPTMFCPHWPWDHFIAIFILLDQSAGIHFIQSQIVGKYAVRWNWQEATVVVHIMSMNIIHIYLSRQTSQTSLILLYQIPLKAYNFQWLLTLAAYLHSLWQPSGGTTPENTLHFSHVSSHCQLIYSAKL